MNMTDDNTHAEIKKIQKQMRDMKMIMLKMDKRMKTMEKLLMKQVETTNESKTNEIISTQNQETGFGTNMTMSDIHDDNVGFLNKKYKLYNSNVKNIYNDVFRDVIHVTKNDIINIVDEEIDMIDFIVDAVIEINGKDRFLHAFPRDKGRIYEYKYDDHVWYEMKNKDIISMYKKAEQIVLTQYTDIIADDDAFMNKIFDKMGVMYKNDISKKVNLFRKKLVEKLVIY